jgi:NADH dehydrogenase FAD-containing subunit
MDVDPATLRSTKASNVWAVGDISSVATSKTAVAAGAEARVVVKQLAAIARGEKDYVLKDEDKYDGYTACPIPTGQERLILAEFSGTTGKIMESFPFIQV